MQPGTMLPVHERPRDPARFVSLRCDSNGAPILDATRDRPIGAPASRTKYENFREYPQPRRRRQIGVARGTQGEVTSSSAQVLAAIALRKPK